MTMTIWQGAITIVTVVLGTMCTRFLPFLVFPESKQPPRIIEYFGRHRAAARMETQYAAFNRRRHNCIYVAGATGVLRHPTR